MLPQRRYPAHMSVVHVREKPKIIFITVCTDKRRRILASAEVHRLLIEVWAEADHWLVGRYVIMPDHVHLFCTPTRDDALPVASWVRFWKSMATKRWPFPVEGEIWQKSCWDRQLRSDENYAQKWNYVRDNPVRHKLVRNSQDWPYQGEINEFRW